MLVSEPRLLEALTDVAESDRPFLKHLQACAEDVVQKFCNRTFAQSDYDELYHGTGTGLLHLNQRPVSQVKAVRFGLQPALYVQNPDQNNFNATIQVTSTALILTRFYSGGQDVQTLTYATYPTLPQMATAINALGNQWKAILGADPFDKGWPSSDLGIFPATHGSRIQQVPLLSHRWYMQSYRVDGAKGELFGGQMFVPGYLNIRVQYSAGFPTIPEPIQAAVIELTRIAFNARPLNTNLSQESLGDWSYTLNPAEAFKQLSAPTRLGVMQYVELATPRWS